MRVSLQRHDDEARFVLADVEEGLHPAAAALAFAPCAEGFERRFPWRDDVEAIFRRFEVSIETTLRQHAGLVPVPWHDALHALAARLGGDLAWSLVGSAALAVRGVAITPHDLDLVVAEADVERVAARLVDVLVEPPVVSDAWIARCFGRAYLGVRVEWVAGVAGWVDEPVPSDFGAFAWERRERLVWEGVQLALPPLALQLDAARRRGLSERVAAIEEHLASTRGPDTSPTC
jgi:hypothetical protein